MSENNPINGRAWRKSTRSNAASDNCVEVMSIGVIVSTADTTGQSS
jgi:hypothetical protein